MDGSDHFKSLLIDTSKFNNIIVPKESFKRLLYANTYSKFYYCALSLSCFIAKGINNKSLLVTWSIDNLLMLLTETTNVPIESIKKNPYTAFEDIPLLSFLNNINKTKLKDK